MYVQVVPFPIGCHHGSLCDLYERIELPPGNGGITIPIRPVDKVSVGIQLYPIDRDFSIFDEGLYIHTDQDGI